jgi:hypothetical protein
MAPIDVDRLRVRSVQPGTRRARPPRHAKGESFLKGPIPLAWLEAAARLPGRSLHAGLALWYAAGLTRSAVVPLSNLSGVRFGLDRNAKYRALEWLEGAGLVKVERKLGRAPVVTILQPGAPP